MPNVHVSISTDPCDIMMLYLILQAVVLVISERFHVRVETAREINDKEATKTLNELFTANA